MEIGNVFRVDCKIRNVIGIPICEIVVGPWEIISFSLSKEITYVEEENNRNIGRWRIYRGRGRIQMGCRLSVRRRINKGRWIWIIIVFFKCVSTNTRMTRTFKSLWDWPLTWSLFGLEFYNKGSFSSLFLFSSILSLSPSPSPSVKTF